MRNLDVARSGEASKRLTALVLDVYGVVCWLQLPGCTGRATTKDHVIPVQQGGTDAMENLRPACHTCNSRRRDMSIGGTPGGILVTFYLGPLADRCEAAARAAAVGDDIVLSPGLMLQSISPSTKHPHPRARQIAHRAFTAAMQQTLRMRAPIHVRIAAPVPSVKQLQTWARMRYFTDITDPGRAAATQAVALADREQQIEVSRWYDRYPEGTASIERAAARRQVTAMSPSVPAPTDLEPSRRW